MLLTQWLYACAPVRVSFRFLGFSAFVCLFALVWAAFDDAHKRDFVQGAQHSMGACNTHSFLDTLPVHTHAHTHILTHSRTHTHTHHARTHRTSAHAGICTKTSSQSTARAGGTALCLSGGGAIAMYHMGLVSELLAHSLLPKVRHATPR